MSTSNIVSWSRCSGNTQKSNMQQLFQVIFQVIKKNSRTPTDVLKLVPFWKWMPPLTIFGKVSKNFCSETLSILIFLITQSFYMIKIARQKFK